MSFSHSSPSHRSAGIRYGPFGTYIKLFNYELTGYKTVITRDFYDRLSLLIPNLALPIRFRDTREYNGNTNAANLAGLISRLYDNRSSILENGFPTSSIITVDGQRISFSVYLLKQDTEKKYRGKHEGVLFCMNGQTHHIIPDSFFSHVNLSYIKNSVLVIADCSEIDVDHQEELFMPSRDRLRNSDFTKEIIARLEKDLREHPGLKKAAHDRRNAALKDRLADNKPLKDVLQNIFKKSTVLTKLFIAGQEISSPFNTTYTAGQGESYEGKLHPTFFKLKGKFKDGKLVKAVPCNASFRVQFDTDVQNDYFNRPSEAGSLVLKMDGVIRTDLIQHLSLYNGQANLTVALPAGAADGDMHVFETEIQDDCIVNSFGSIFHVNVIGAEEPRSGGVGVPHRPTDPNKNGNQQTPSSFAIPKIVPVKREDWDQHGMDRFSALIYVPTDEGGDYYLNMENDYLLTELKGIRDQSRIELTKARYTYSMALIGMSIISYYKNNASETEGTDVPAVVKRISAMISPVLIPMLESMADLEIDDISMAA